MEVNSALRPSDLAAQLAHFWDLSAQKIESMAARYDEPGSPPVCTVEGKYTGRAWTDWTRGFHYGSAILQYDATGDERCLILGRKATVARMTPYLTDFGVHDHGFNVVSTYGNLWRLMKEGRTPSEGRELGLYELALKVSGAVQAKRWTDIAGGLGFIYSFNGAHSLFVDTVRSLRSLALAHVLGQGLRDETERQVSLLDRLKRHAVTTARFCVYYGEGRDIYDVRGRVAHEGLFNLADGSYRCPSTQQGYSPFSTWTRGLAWAMCGFAEQLELLRALDDNEVTPVLLEAARATCDFYIDGATGQDGVPYWDTGAPGLALLGDWRAVRADPFNAHEPVDSSAAAIAAQGLLRLGVYLDDRRYLSAGLTVASVLFGPPYLSEDPEHQGLLLHSVYHRPKGWDRASAGQSVPCGESSMWGDYHGRELALLIGRLAGSGPYPTFFAGGQVG
ncbi:MAG: glycosyl hydrolase [Acidimicrobiales bacterium]|jgi:unsaturated chondroitin disaccharide hydrolase